MGGKTIYDSLQRCVRDEYDVEKTLKISERGMVLLIRHKKTKSRYIFRSFIGSGEAYGKLLDLSCPHLPRIEATAEKGGQVTVLEEYVPGDTLAYILEGPPLSADQAKDIAIQICRALDALHGLGIVHRDIKPENILLRGSEAVVIDFDASRISKPEHTSDTRIMGTTGYAAPEQYGFSQTDARADIYAMGVLLNEMLTKQHPATQLAEGPLRPVIERCIEVNVDKRFSSAEALIAALENVSLSGQKKSHRLWMLPAAALCAVLLLLLPKKTPTPTPANNSSGEPSTPTPFPATLLSDPSLEIWTGPLESDITEFEYDLDGDGKTETYIFTLGHNLGGPHGLSLYGTDSRVPHPDIPSELIIAPAVVKQTENGLQYAYEFADLLENPEVTLYCSQQWGTDVPELYTAPPLDNLWPNACRILFEAEDTGVWVYEITAELDGESLSARGVSYVLSTLPSGDAP